MKKRGIFVLIAALFFVGVYALNFEDRLQSDFSGTYNNTFYNTSGFIQLNASVPGNTSTVTSNVSELVGDESGLISYWRLNESSWSGAAGEVKDVLGKSNGTALGANTTLGLFGNAGNFSGTLGTYTNEVQIVNREELNPGTGSFTITGWAKSITRGGNGYQLYVAKRDNISGGKNGYYLGLLEGSGIKFVVGDGTNRIDTSYVNVGYTNWFHFAAVINRTSNQSLLYINGSLSTSANIASVGKINNSWNLSIGNDEGQALLGATWQYPVKGQIDEIALWNRALGSSEIQALYQKGLANSTTVTTNGTNITSGTYESEVKDAGRIVNWTNLSWNGVSSAVSVSNPVLLAHFDESSGTIIDSSSYSNNGTNSGASYGATGKMSNALSFDGVNDYVSFGNPSHLQIANNITLSAWVKFNQIPSGTTVMSVISKNEGGGYGIIANEQLSGGLGRLVTYFHIGGSYKNAGVDLSTLSSGTWYHILASYNGSSVDFYLDGVKKESVAATGTISNVAYNVLVGANPGPSGVNTEYFNGTIDEVYIFNRSLTSSEISSLSGSSGSNLIFQIRAGNSNPITSDFVGPEGTTSSYYTSPQTLGIQNSRYLQYKAYLTSSDVRLYNVSLVYNAIADLTVSLDSPADNYLTNKYNDINVTCSASSTSSLSNITAYYDKFGWAPVEPARIISGTTNTTTFTLNEISSEIKWNCLACSSDGECTFANSNRTIIGDIFPPTINLLSPVAGQVENLSSSINFVFNANDNRATSLACRLLIDDVEVASNSSVVSGINTTFSSSLSDGNYSWEINCSDGVNSALSEERNISVDISSAYIPFWAKVNTHTHTTYSDGTSTLETVLSTYKNLGYNIIAITDHSKVNPNCSVSTNLSARFICVNSEEWTTPKHITRINVSSAIGGTNTQVAVSSANNDGGFAIVAHPNWSSTIWTLNELTSLENYTAMEIYNHVIERLTPDPYAVNKWDDVLKTGKKVFGVAVDDMHIISSDLGFGWTKVYMPEFTKQAYIDSMRAGYFYSSQGPDMDLGPFNLTCDEDTNYHMGETANCSAVRINAIISATNSSFVMRNISLIKDGSVLNLTVCSTQNCSFSYSQNVSSSGYYRLQAIDSNNKQIWSNPIWVNKIALPVVITVNSPQNNSDTNDYTPLINLSLNQQTSLWYSVNGGTNVSLCGDCASYSGYSRLIEGQNFLRFYANNSDNIVREKEIYVNLNFNKSISENFSDNSSIESMSNVVWNSGRVSMGAGSMFGSVILKPVVTTNNITSFHIEFVDNNTADARGDGQRIPIILKYKFGSGSWVDIEDENYIFNGSDVDELNSNNLSLMFDFEKNNYTPIDLLSFRLTWTEFTVPLISNLSSGVPGTTSATISWNTDLPANSSVLYGQSTSLGQIKSLNDSTTLHSVALTGLVSGASYFYKVLSCTDSSCSQFPQEPYLPYSFMTQTVSAGGNTGSGGSGSSGGGGGGVPPKVYNSSADVNIEFSSLPTTNIKKGTTSEVVLTVTNREKIFLNNCGLRFSGSAASWIKSSQSSGLSQGEKVNYLMTVSVPENVEPDKYSANVLIQCDEGRADRDISFSVYRNNFEAEISSYEKKDNQLVVIYALEEYANIEHSLSIDYFFKDTDNVTRYGGNVKVSLGPQEERTETVSFNLPKDSFGEFVFEMKFNDGSSEITATKEVFLPSQKGLSGLVISDSNRRALSIFGVILVAVLFIIFAFWTARRLKKKTRRIEVMEHSKSGQRGRKFITVEI